MTDAKGVSEGGDDAVAAGERGQLVPAAVARAVVAARSAGRARRASAGRRRQGPDRPGEGQHPVGRAAHRGVALGRVQVVQRGRGVVAPGRGQGAVGAGQGRPGPGRVVRGLGQRVAQQVRRRPRRAGPRRARRRPPTRRWRWCASAANRRPARRSSPPRRGAGSSTASQSAPWASAVQVGRQNPLRPGGRQAPRWRPARRRPGRRAAPASSRACPAYLKVDLGRTACRTGSADARQDRVGRRCRNAVPVALVSAGEQSARRAVVVGRAAVGGGRSPSSRSANATVCGGPAQARQLVGPAELQRLLQVAQPAGSPAW